MNRKEFQELLESKGLDKAYMPMYGGGGVRINITESTVSFRSTNESCLKSVEKMLGIKGVINGDVLSYQF